MRSKRKDVLVGIMFFGGVVLMFWFLFTHHLPDIKHDHSLFIPSPGFAAKDNGIAIFFNGPFVDGRIKVLVDDGVYYIKLEKEMIR